MKILIVEDDPDLNHSIIQYLSANYVCESVNNYDDALDKIDLYEYDCIVLDIMLPGGSGIQLLKYLKQERSTDGVIIISAKDSLDDKLEGLQLGADDYLTKPFYLPELSSRIAAIIRRRNMQGNSKLILNDLVIDTQAKTVFVHGKLLDLTLKEYQLLLYMVVNKNRVLSKNTIAEHLWGDDMNNADNFDFIYTHVKNVRRKMLQAGGEDCIKSVYGMGYKLQA
jgi:DNA-binding response OmpR family regulator